MRIRGSPNLAHVLSSVVLKARKVCGHDLTTLSVTLRNVQAAAPIPGDDPSPMLIPFPWFRIFRHSRWRQTLLERSHAEYNDAKHCRLSGPSNTTISTETGYSKTLCLACYASANHAFRHGLHLAHDFYDPGSLEFE